MIDDDMIPPHLMPVWQELGKPQGHDVRSWIAGYRRGQEAGREEMMAELVEAAKRAERGRGHGG